MLAVHAKSSEFRAILWLICLETDHFRTRFDARGACFVSPAGAQWPGEAIAWDIAMNLMKSMRRSPPSYVATKDGGFLSRLAASCWMRQLPYGLQSSAHKIRSDRVNESICLCRVHEIPSAQKADLTSNYPNSDIFTLRRQSWIHHQIGPSLHFKTNSNPLVH